MTPNRQPSARRIRAAAVALPVLLLAALLGHDRVQPGGYGGVPLGKIQRDAAYHRVRAMFAGSADTRLPGAEPGIVGRFSEFRPRARRMYRGSVAVGGRRARAGPHAYPRAGRRQLPQGRRYRRGAPHVGRVSAQPSRTGSLFRQQHLLRSNHRSASGRPAEFRLGQFASMNVDAAVKREVRRVNYWKNK